MEGGLQALDLEQDAATGWLGCLPHHVGAHQPTSNGHPFEVVLAYLGNPKEESALIRKVADDQTEGSLKAMYWLYFSPSEGRLRPNASNEEITGKKVLEAALAVKGGTRELGEHVRCWEEAPMGGS